MHSQTDDAFFRALLAGAHDPRTTPAQLQAIAQYATHMPQLIPGLLAHPNMYPALAQWLRALPGVATGATHTASPDDADDDETVLASTILPGAAAAVSAGGVTAAGLAGTTGAGAATEAAGLTVSAPLAAGHVAAAAPAGSAGAAGAGTATASGAAAGAKIAAGVAAAAVATGGGTIGYIAWQNNQAETTTDTVAAAPAHASLSDTALRELLKTAPVSDSDRALLGYKTDDPSSLHYTESWLAPAISRENFLGVTIDGTFRLQADQAQIDPSRTTSQKPFIHDVNADGAADVVSISLMQTPYYDGAWTLANVVAYTPNADGSALEILDELPLVDSRSGRPSPELEKVYTGSVAAVPDLTSYICPYNTATANACDVFSTSDDNLLMTLNRGEHTLESPSEEITFRLDWVDGALAPQLLSIR
ncbi:variant leucine-rich repeat-containing protein [Pseudoclavibacter sp. 13-3]|uniref:variant leucine-rich repeat-containing protein n=1 Tax=Pseudoclavibacter sp. 13-3 TaxID=2901228 RepID=UPI001E582F52|nr:hypothetical protein [Pseudoclavibacter sp. 13-3]MCD7101195.1 hypothetical protein [Pseudoclavibacter sp. 13-3]